MKVFLCFFLFIIVFFSFSTGVKSQNKLKWPFTLEQKKDSSFPIFKDTFKIAVVRNRPDSIRNLSVMLMPAYIDLYGINVNMGYEASLKYNFQRYHFWATYRGSYFDFIYKNTVDENNSIGGPATSIALLQNAEVGVDFTLKSETNFSEELVKLGRIQNYLISRPVNITSLAQNGFRFGLQYFSTYISGDQIPFSGYYINDPAKKIIHFGLGQVGTMMQENIINGGISHTVIHDVMVQNAQLGRKQLSYSTSIYGDILFAPSIVYTNVIMKNYAYISREAYTDFNLNSATDKNRFGLRVGFTYSDLTKAGLSFGFETGLRPGPNVQTGFFFLSKFGLVLNSRL